MCLGGSLSTLYLFWLFINCHSLFCLIKNSFQQDPEILVYVGGINGNGSENNAIIIIIIIIGPNCFLVRKKFQVSVYWSLFSVYTSSLYKCVKLMIHLTSAMKAQKICLHTWFPSIFQWHLLTFIFSRLSSSYQWIIKEVLWLGPIWTIGMVPEGICSVLVILLHVLSVCPSLRVHTTRLGGPIGAREHFPLISLPEKKKRRVCNYFSTKRSYCSVELIN